MKTLHMSLRGDYNRFLIASVALLAACYAAPAFALVYFNGTAAVECPDTADGGYIWLVVTCLQEAITAATIVFLAEFSDAMYTTILALITLQVTLFGVQAVMGVAEIEKKAMALLIKIGVVLTFGQNLGGFAPDVFAIMEEIIGVVLRIVGTGSVSCDTANAGGFAGGEVWRKLDCMIHPLFNWENPELLFNSIFALSSAALFSGSIGVMVFLMTVMALLSVLFFAFYAAYIYILSVIYVGFLIVMSPLLIPLLLVGVNIGVFEKWLHNLMAGMAIPVFVLLYLVITLPLLANAVTDNGQSIGQVLGDDYSNWYRNEQQWCSQQIGTDYDHYRTDNYKNIPDKTIDHVLGPLRNILTPMMSGNTDYCAPIQSNSVDFREQHVPMLMDISDSMILLLVTAYLLKTLMKAMAGLGASIFHGGFSIASLGHQGMFFDSALRGGKNETRSALSMVGGTKGGLGFLSKGVPGVK